MPAFRALDEDDVECQKDGQKTVCDGDSDRRTDEAPLQSLENKGYQ